MWGRGAGDRFSSIPHQNAIPESAPPECRVECSLDRAKRRRWSALGVEAGLHARAESSQRKTLSPVRCTSSVVLYTVSQLHSFGAVAEGISWTSRQEERCVVDAPLDITTETAPSILPFLRVQHVAMFGECHHRCTCTVVAQGSHGLRFHPC